MSIFLHLNLIFRCILYVYEQYLLFMMEVDTAVISTFFVAKFMKSLYRGKTRALVTPMKLVSRAEALLSWLLLPCFFCGVRYARSGCYPQRAGTAINDEPSNRLWKYVLKGLLKDICDAF